MKALLVGGSIVLLLLGRPAWAAESKAASDDDTESSSTESATDMTLRERFWTEIIGQTKYSHEDRNNVVFDSAVLSGVHLFKLRDQWVDFYTKTRLGSDTRSDFWNNRLELGLGVRYRPFKNLGLVLFNEVMYGHYYRGDLSNHDPEASAAGHDRDYWADRVGAAFWQWWGRQPCQLTHNEYYLPFTGWREVYADTIYLSEQRNLIANLAYKEGLMLGKIGSVNYDAHLTLEAGTDANGDFWNNYLKFGPGVRIAPFKDKDVNINLDFLLGHYYRGQVEDRSRSFVDPCVTLSFSFDF